MDNACDSGGRVTRSLRKRLASVDSDNSSRPGTPISTKLPSIAEMPHSPSRATRSTRRNSITSTATTPGKSTASSLFLAESSEQYVTPKKASRRRSVSANENDDQQTVTKFPKIEVLHEENLLSDETQTRNARSKSKSPNKFISCIKTPVKTPKVSRRLSVSANENDVAHQTVSKHTKIEVLFDENLINDETQMSNAHSKSKSPNNSISGITTPVKTPVNLHTSSAKPLLSAGSPVKNVLKTPTDEKFNKTILQNNEKQTSNRMDDYYSPKKSKSPNVFKNNDTEGSNMKITTLKKKSPGLKSENQIDAECSDISDVEVIVLEYEINDKKDVSSNMAVVVLTDDDDSAQNSHCRKDFEDQNEDVMEPTEISVANLHDTEQNIYLITDRKILENRDEIASKKEIHENKNDSQLEELATLEILKDETKNVINENNLTLNNSLSHSDVVNNCKDIIINLDKCETTDSKQKGKVETDTVLKTPEKVKILSVSTVTFPKPNVTMKKVDFMSSPSNDVLIKSVYPKTPASLKSGFRSSLMNKNQDIELIEDNKIEINDTSENVKKLSPINFKQVLETEADREKEISTKVIYNDLESSLPEENDKLNESCNPKSHNHSDVELKEHFSSKENAAEDLEQDEALNNGSDYDDGVFDDSYSKIAFSPEPEEFQKGQNYSEENKTGIEKALKQPDCLNESNNKESENFIESNQNEENLKWMVSSTKGKSVEGSKIDVVLPGGNDSIGNTVATAEKLKDQNNSFSSNYDIDFDEQEVEESYMKHDLIDDEAMEVNDYKSGDSMDSEERREIEENAIPVVDESIGSQSTSDDQDEYADEEDSSNSFIVSDTEDLDNPQSNSEQSSEESLKIKKNPYKRIQCPIESSLSSDIDIEEQRQSNCCKNETDDIKLDVQKDEEIPVSLIENEHNTERSFVERDSPNKSYNNDSSKLSKSAQRLHTKSLENNKSIEINSSHEKIISNLNHSDRSVPDLTLDVDESPIKQFAHNLEEIPFKSENYAEKENENKSENNIDKENENKSLLLSNDRKTGCGLSVSFGHFKEPKENLQWQRSFTIGDSVKDGELGTAPTDVKSKENGLYPSHSTDNQEMEELEAKGIECVDNLRHIPLHLGNPLIRTRRQPLALPPNPDMKICSKKIDRKSCNILPDIDFKTSLSFIENTEFQKKEENQLGSKRKRLSKSFCGSTEAHDHTVIDTRHIHKKSKLIVENSDEELTENMSSCNIFTKISSTPHEKVKKNDSFNKRILGRCDEILEAANRAKLEAKKRNKKTKTKTLKKLKKKSVTTSSEETYPEEKTVSSISSEIKCKDKTKAAIFQAFMTADAILSNTKTSYLNKEKPAQKHLKPNVIESVKEISPIKKICLKEIAQPKEKIQNIYATSAGNFVELQQTPERKKKKITYIQVPTGTVCVEPITPKKCFGQAFRESPLNPKRCIDESSKDSRTLRNTQWTSSGLFTEELTSNSIGGLKKTKKRQIERKKHMVYQNFKENALSRPEINRSTKRELFLMQKRKQV